MTSNSGVHLWEIQEALMLQLMIEVDVSTISAQEWIHSSENGPYCNSERHVFPPEDVSLYEPVIINETGADQRNV